jgi:hypothetical protein
MTLYCSREQVDHSRMSRKMSDGVSTRTLSLAELPAKSHFDQVHQASGFGAFELSQNPVLRVVQRWLFSDHPPITLENYSAYPIARALPHSEPKPELQHRSGFGSGHAHCLDLHRRDTLRRDAAPSYPNKLLSGAAPRSGTCKCPP